MVGRCGGGGRYVGGCEAAGGLKLGAPGVHPHQEAGSHPPGCAASAANATLHNLRINNTWCVCYVVQLGESKQRHYSLLVFRDERSLRFPRFLRFSFF